MKAQVWDELKAHVWDELKAQVWDELKAHVWDELKAQVWDELKAHVLKYQPTVAGQVLYMCHYCKTRVRSGDMPARCVLNGLQTVPIPKELAKLDLLSRQLIQRAKCYQTIMRLGTYTGKVPTYKFPSGLQRHHVFPPFATKQDSRNLESG